MNSNTPPITFPVDTLLDQSANQGTAPPGTLRRLENLEKKSESGALTKRNGYGVVVSNTSVRLFAHDDEVLNVSTEKVETIRKSATNTERDRAPLFRLTARRSIYGDASTNAVYGAVAIQSGYRVWVWQQDNAGTNEIWALVLNHSTGEPLDGPRLISESGTDSAVPRIVAVPAATPRFDVFWMETVGASVVRRAHMEPGTDITSWTIESTPISSQLDGTNTETLDATVGGTTASPKVYVAYGYDDTVDKGVEVHEVEGATTWNTTHGAIGQVSIVSAVDDSYVWVSENQGNDVRVWVLNTALTLQDTVDIMSEATETIKCATLGRMSGDKAAIALTRTEAGISGQGYRVRWNVITFAAGSATVETADAPRIAGCVASKPFEQGTDVYCWIDVNGNKATAIGRGVASSRAKPYVSTALVRLTTDGTLPSTAKDYAEPVLVAAVGRTAWGHYSSIVNTTLGATVIDPEDQAPQAPAVDGSDWYWGASVRVKPTDTFGDARGIDELAITTTDGTDSPAWVPADAGRVTLLSGGCMLCQWDGGNFHEVGFVEVPDEFSVTTGTAGAIDDGSRQYAITFEYIDGAGQRHQSAPIIDTTVRTVSTGNNGSITYRVRACQVHSLRDHVDESRDRVRAVLWRTGDGPDGVYHRVIDIENDAATGYMDLADVYSDSDVDSNEILYTAQGQLEHSFPPISRHVIPWQSAAAGIDAEYPNRVWFTKRRAYRDGHAYSAALQQWVFGLGDLTALAEWSGSLYAFSETGAAIVAYGSGIDNAGGGALPEPQVIFRGVGCVDARAVAVCPDGVMFASGADGRTRIWMLPGGAAQPVEVGSKVRLELDTYSTVTGMVHAAAHARVYVEVLDAATDESRTLVYDYGNRGPDGQGVWYVWVAQHYDRSIRTTTFAAGEHWLGGLDAYYLDASTYEDAISGDTAWIGYTVETHDLRIGALAPFGKINGVALSYEYFGNGTPQIEFSTDGGETFGTPYTDAVTSDPGVDLINRFVQPAIKRLYSGLGFRVRLTDISPDGGTTTNSASVVPRSVTVDYLPLPGTLRARSGERMAQ